MKQKNTENLKKAPKILKERTETSFKNPEKNIY